MAIQEDGLVVLLWPSQLSHLSCRRLRDKRYQTLDIHLSGWKKSVSDLHSDRGGGSSRGRVIIQHLAAPDRITHSVLFPFWKNSLVTTSHFLSTSAATRINAKARL